MSRKDDPQNVIDSYKKRQQTMPVIIGGLAGLLIVGGLVLMIFWLSGPNKPALFSTSTFTPTLTFTSTPIPPTETPTITASVTATAMPTATNTPSGPFQYTIVEGDYCQKIADQFGTVVKALIILNPSLGANCNIRVGDNIFIPQPGAPLPTNTPIPPNIKPGTLIEYSIEPGDTIGKIAEKFNSDSDKIMTTNKIKDANLIYVGQVLKIPVNIVTVVPTRPPSITPGGTQIGGNIVGSTIVPSVTVTPNK